MAYSPLLTMPNELKKLQMDVLECVGAHTIFPNGVVYTPTIRTIMPWPYDTSVTIRGFFYRPNTSTNAVVEMYYSDYYYMRTFTSGNKVLWSYSGVESPKKDQEYPEVQRNTGGFFSLAVQIDGKKLRGISNTQKAPLRSFYSVKGYYWHYFVHSNATIVSLHHYYEDKSQVSPEYWALATVKIPIIPVNLGAFAVYTLKYTGGTSDLTFWFAGMSGEMVMPLKKDDEFKLYVRNSPDGYFVNSSFQQAVVKVQRASGTNLPDAQFSNNVDIIRVVVKAGV